MQPTMATVVATASTGGDIDDFMGGGDMDDFMDMDVVEKVLYLLIRHNHTL